MTEEKRKVAVPKEWQDVFTSFIEFNEMQSECFSDLVNSDRNMVISAPTGSGKSALFELAILRVLRVVKSNRKGILYLAPSKAIVGEKKMKWDKCFGKKVIVSTPESFLTQYGAVQKLLELDLTLVLVDEVHLLSQVKRGPKLELLIVRLKKYFPNARFIVAAADILNLSDLSIFFKHFDGVPAKTKKFASEELRNSNHSLKVLGYKPFGNNRFMFESSLDKKLLQILDQYPKGISTLIFCSTKKSCEKAATILAKSGRFSREYRKFCVDGPHIGGASQTRCCIPPFRYFFKGSIQS